MRVTINHKNGKGKRVEGISWFTRETVQYPVFIVELILEFTQEELATIKQYNLYKEVVYVETGVLAKDDDMRRIAMKYGEAARFDRMDWRLEHFMNGPRTETFDTPGEATIHEHLLREKVIPNIKSVIDINSLQRKSSTFDV